MSRKRDAAELEVLEKSLPRPFQKSVIKDASTGAVMAVYDFPWAKDGGMAVLRHSAAEDPDKEGSTTEAQFGPIKTLCEREGLELSTVVVTFNNSGTHRWEQRCDLQLLNERLRSTGAPQFVMFSEGDRFTRNLGVADMMLSVVRLVGTQFWLVDVGRPVDPEADELLVWIKAVIAAAARNAHIERTRRGRIVSWTVGRITGPRPFAVQRDEQGYPVFDPERYEVVRRVYEMAAEAGPGGSAKAIAKALTADGHPISEAQVRTLIKSDTYVSGLISRIDHMTGQVFWLRKMPMDNPIPRELHERALRMLGNRSGSPSQGVLQTPNSLVTLEHGSCEGEHHDDGRPIRLTSRIRPRDPNRRRIVLHELTPDTPACSGLTLSDEEVERAICQALVVAAECLPHHECQTPEEEAELRDLERLLVERLDELVCRSVVEEVPISAITDSLARQADQVRTRLRALALDPLLTASRHYLATRENLVWAAQRILLAEGRDPLVIELRALLFDRGISRAVTHTDDEHQLTGVTVYGAKVNNSETGIPRRFFLNTCATVLVEYLEHELRDCCKPEEEGSGDMTRTAHSGIESRARRVMSLRRALKRSVDHQIDAADAHQPAWSVHLDIPANTAHITVGETEMTPDQALEWTRAHQLPQEVEDEAV